MNSTIKKVTINAPNLEAYKLALNDFDSEIDRLYVEASPSDLEGMEFVYEGKTFVVSGSDVEDHEEPLLEAMLKGFEQFNEDVEDEAESNASGYYTTDDPSGNFPTDFRNHTEWCFTNGERYARNVPGLNNGDVIGFYWIPLSGIMHLLQTSGEGSYHVA
jgi:hypothetical protein